MVRPRRARDARVAPHRRGGVVVRARRALRARVHHPHVDAHAARLGVGDTAGRVAGVRGDAAAAVGAGGGDAPPLARALRVAGGAVGGGVDPWGVFAPPGSEARWAGARAPKHLFPAASREPVGVAHAPGTPPDEIARDALGLAALLLSHVAAGAAACALSTAGAAADRAATATATTTTSTRTRR